MLAITALTFLVLGLIYLSLQPEKDLRWGLTDEQHRILSLIGDPLKREQFINYSQKQNFLKEEKKKKVINFFKNLVSK